MRKPECQQLTGSHLQWLAIALSPEYKKNEPGVAWVRFLTYNKRTDPFFEQSSITSDHARCTARI
eukprot:scaffold430600_cov15-Prasinocladus_malaysianus.AAC.1